MRRTFPAEIVQVLAVTERIMPLLCGRPPEIQGAILAELTSMWIGGFHPDLRKEMFELHLETTKKLIPENDAWRRAATKRTNDNEQ